MSKQTAADKAAMVIGFPEYQPQARALADELGLPYRCVNVHRFPDGERKLRLPETLPENSILCRSLDHPDHKLLELLLAAAGARQLGAKTVSLVAPYLCYMRQDKAFNPGEVVSQKVIGKLLADYFDCVVTVDAHLHRVHDLADAVPARCAVNSTAAAMMASFVHRRVENPYLLGPDSESEQWVRAIASPHQTDYGVAKKERRGDRDVKVSLPNQVGEGRNVILVDDVASTGKTLWETARALSKYHPASISVLVTHALFVENAIEQLRGVGVVNIWSCDSISHPTNGIKLAGVLAEGLIAGRALMSPG